MLNILVQKICNRKLAKRQAEIEELIDNYDEAVLNSNERIRNYYEEKRTAQRELISYLKNENKRYINIINEIILITKSFADEYLQIVEIGFTLFNALLKQQLTQYQINILKASIEIVENEVKPIDKLLSLYKSQSDISLRVDYLKSICSEFHTLNITAISQFERYINEKQFSQIDNNDIIMVCKKRSYKRVSIRLDNDEKLRNLITELKQKRQLLKKQKAKLLREKRGCINNIKDQQQTVYELKEAYKNCGNVYYTDFYNINTELLLREIFLEEENLDNSLKDIRKKQSELKDDRTDIISRQSEIRFEINKIKEEKHLIKSEIKRLYDSISFCKISENYLNIENLKLKLTREKENLSSLKNELLKLESSRNYYNQEYQKIRVLQIKSSDKYSKIKKNLNELNLQKKNLIGLLNKSISPFKPVNIVFLFNSLNEEIPSVGSYTPPRLPTLRRNKT